MPDSDPTCDVDDSSNQDTWPSREACAAELAAVTGRKVTATTLKRWIYEYKLKIPRKGPIRKAAILRWAQHDLPPVGRPPSKDPTGGEDELRSRYLQEQIRHLQNRNEVLEGTRLDAATVSRDLTTAASALRSELMGDLPIRFVEAIRELPVEAAVDEIRRLQGEAINRFCDSSHEVLGLERGAPEPTPE